MELWQNRGMGKYKVYALMMANAFLKAGEKNRPLQAILHIAVQANDLSSVAQDAG